VRGLSLRIRCSRQKGGPHPVARRPIEMTMLRRPDAAPVDCVALFVRSVTKRDSYAYVELLST